MVFVLSWWTVLHTVISQQQHPRDFTPQTHSPRVELKVRSAPLTALLTLCKRDKQVHVIIAYCFFSFAYLYDYQATALNWDKSNLNEPG